MQLFDKHGDFICPAGIKHKVVPAKMRFKSKLKLPAGYVNDDFAHDITRRLAALWPDSSLPAASLIKEKIFVLVEKAEREASNMLKGSWFPVAIPFVPGINYGALNKDGYDSINMAIKSAYDAHFPERTFNQLISGESLARSHCQRHAKANLPLPEAKSRMMFGILTVPFGGYSVDAVREVSILGDMPDGLILGSFLETAFAAMTWPEIFFECEAVPTVQCAATNLLEEDCKFIPAYGQETVAFASYNTTAAVMNFGRTDHADGFLTSSLFYYDADDPFI